MITPESKHRLKNAHQLITDVIKAELQLEPNIPSSYILGRIASVCDQMDLIDKSTKHIEEKLKVQEKPETQEQKDGKEVKDA